MFSKANLLLYFSCCCFFSLPPPVWDVDGSSAVPGQGPKRNHEPDSEVRIFWNKLFGSSSIKYTGFPCYRVCYLFLLEYVLTVLWLPLQGTPGNASVPERGGTVPPQGSVQEEPGQPTRSVAAARQTLWIPVSENKHPASLFVSILTSACVIHVVVVSRIRGRRCRRDQEAHILLHHRLECECLMEEGQHFADSDSNRV